VNPTFQDLRYGVRNLLRTPGFTLTAILALTLGIGATAAIFSMVNGVVLKPLPYGEPDRLVTIWDANHERALEREPLSPVTFLDYRALGQVFVDAAAWWRPEVNLRDSEREPLRVNTVEVSGNFLPVLGTQPVIGPGFPAGVFYSTDRMALISHRLWLSRFGGDRAIVGRTIRLNDSEYEVAGVMPAGFNFPGETDVWQRLSWDLARHSRGAHFMEAVGRLRPGVTVAQAQREIDALTARLSAEFTGTNRGWGARVIALHDEVVGSFRKALFVLLAAVGLLLLIACINVASLLLARAASRAREVAVRSAIGATQSRLIRQFLTESLLLAAVGTAGGIAFAIAAMRGIVAMTPVAIPRIAEASVDSRVILFAALLAIVTAVAFGMLPALFMARADAQSTLKDGGRGAGSGRGRSRAHRALVGAEIALAVMLLVGAGLLLRSVRHLASEDPGFRPADVLTSGVQLTGAAYARWPAVEQFHSSLVDIVRQQPGVVAAGASNFLPLAPGWRVSFLVRGRPAPPRGDEPTAQYHSVSEGYFETLRAPLLRGRFFDARDTAQSRGVVVINETLARRYFGGEDPVGKTIVSLARGIGPLGASLMEDRNHEVIGVVGDIKNSSLQTAAEPALFHTQRQFPFRHMFIVARGADGGDAARIGAAIRASVRRADAALPLAELRTMEDVVGASVERPRFLMFIMAVFAASAASLAALGIYGLLAYSVTERQQELSVRLALGAQRSGVLWMVLRQGLVLAIAGSATGLACAWIAARQLTSLLHGVAPADPLTFTAVTALALTVSLVACTIPAWRAARTNPLDGLRD
jgi:putative ABC transport system permease protein